MVTTKDFISLTPKNLHGKEFFINTNKIAFITALGDGSAVFFSGNEDDHIEVEEKISEIEELIDMVSQNAKPA